MDFSPTDITSQKMKFPINDFFSKCDQIHRQLRIWSHLLKKSLMENFTFCATSFLNGHFPEWKISWLDISPRGPSPNEQFLEWTFPQQKVLRMSSPQKFSRITYLISSIKRDWFEVSIVKFQSLLLQLSIPQKEMTALPFLSQTY